MIIADALSECLRELDRLLSSATPATPNRNFYGVRGIKVAKAVA